MDFYAAYKTAGEYLDPNLISNKTHDGDVASVSHIWHTAKPYFFFQSVIV